jgi:hypothetical protein
MPVRLALLLALAALTLGGAGCGTAAPDAPAAELRGLRPSAFEAWSARNGTGAFFGAVGPAGGSGVRHAWPE